GVASASPRRAKVLVMISDGLPTECSVAALRGLATTLTKRRGIVCAQVAVRPLDEECFPHHVLLDDSQIDIAVARFGRLIGDLAREELEIVAGPPVRVFTVLANEIARAGDAVGVSCLAFDAFDNPVAMPEHTLALSPSDAGTTATTDTVTAERVGNYEVTCVV